MIVSAAVKIKDLRLNKESIIPCHRHCDAFYILKLFEYKPTVDYVVLSQGFLDEYDNYYTRVEAKRHAKAMNQLKEDTDLAELFSEDLW